MRGLLASWTNEPARKRWTSGWLGRSAPRSHNVAPAVPIGSPKNETWAIQWPSLNLEKPGCEIMKFLFLHSRPPTDSEAILFDTATWASKSQPVFIYGPCLYRVRHVGVGGNTSGKGLSMGNLHHAHQTTRHGSRGWAISTILQYHMAGTWQERVQGLAARPTCLD